MGRGRTEIRRIPNAVSRQVTFGKRRAGLLKKANELAVLCDVDVGLLVFSDAGQPFHYCSPHTSWSELIQRYESFTSAEFQGTGDEDDDQMLTEISELRRERDRLEASLRRQTGEDLPSGATKEELDNLDQQLELTLGRVREMKDELLSQQLDESHRKVHILEDQNSFLRRHMVADDGQQQHAAVKAADADTTTPLFGGFFPEVEEQLSTSLQLWPQQQLPDVPGFGLQPSLRLW
ncbi:MADS-box transcription factor 30-like isoform X2 [Lolium perenne]|uniref:MADS-box transcription factor 30-like isoform X2 n=1 Tax=Lolium perenne TaxID=4522 RepID=UPI0021F5EB3A|nr:MADS-box transcription factor 30-like isoform X2 [Lolium perenne]